MNDTKTAPKDDLPAEVRADTPAPVQATGEAEDGGLEVYLDLGTLPPATVLTEDGLAGIMGKKCRESIKRAVDRGELPRPVKIMGKNCWTVGAIVRYVEDRLEVEARKVARLRPSA